MADSRAQARQIVLHGHIMLNGTNTNIPSCLVNPGDAIAVAEDSKSSVYFQNVAENLGSRPVPSWLAMDNNALVGRVLSLPSREDIDVSLEEQLIVEYYSR
jgi:small subunit ribosomal protein S4